MPAPTFCQCVWAFISRGVWTQVKLRSVPLSRVDRREEQSLTETANRRVYDRSPSLARTISSSYLHWFTGQFTLNIWQIYLA